MPNIIINIPSYFTGVTKAPSTPGNVCLRFCIFSSNELLVLKFLDSFENSKQYKNAGKRIRVYAT